MIPENEKQKGTASDIQFNMGKASGLSQNKRSISDYRTKIDEITDSLKATSQKEAERLNETVRSLSESINKMHAIFLARQQELFSAQEKMIIKISNHFKEDNRLTGKAKDMMDKLLNAGLENFDKIVTSSNLQEKELAAKIAGFGNSSVIVLSAIEKSYIGFVKQLESNFQDFEQFEKGYLQGDALRIALADKKDN